MRALAKDPAHRYQNADEFIAALEAARAAIRSGGDGGHTQGWAPVPPAEPLPERRRRWPWATLLLLLLLGGALLAFLLTRPDMVTVPNEVGKQAPTAAADLVDAGLRPQVVRVKSDKQIGLVVAQDPAAGGRVEKTSTVKLSVSSGPGFTTVPDVTNKPLAKAIKLLKQHHLFANVAFDHHPTIPKGIVISTQPVALSQVLVGSRVAVVVSSGPEQTTVPNVVGQQKPVAEATLSDAGFKVTTLEQSSDRPKNQVIAQSPGAGVTVDKGSRVTITVSKGPQKVKVPDVKGQTKDQAKKTLEGAGFTVTTKEAFTSDSTQVGKVIDQSPAGGAKVKKGSNVTITVGKACPPPGGGGGGGGGGGPSPSPPGCP